MANVNTKKGVIGILTGGGDVPGLNPAIRAVTIRALREGLSGHRPAPRLGGHDRHRAREGLRQQRQLPDPDRGDRQPGRAHRRHVPAHLAHPPQHGEEAERCPSICRTSTSEETNDLTPEVLKNLDWLGIDYLIPIGGDDTLSYGVRLYKEGVKVIAIPKTMDNDVPGTDYCIGFSTCVTRTIEMTNSLRTSAGSHERFLVLEVFGRYAGFTAMLPTMAGAANRCVIPEYKFNIDQLTELLMYDRARTTRASTPSCWSRKAPCSRAAR